MTALEHILPAPSLLEMDGVDLALPIDRAWENLQFTSDPVPSALIRSAEDAQKLGFVKLEGSDLQSMFAPELLAEAVKS